MGRKWFVVFFLLCLPVFTIPARADDAPKKNIDYLELSGQWHFSFDPDDSGLEKGWYRSDFSEHGWALINVPGYWEDEGFSEASGDAGLYDGYAWYRLTFNIPQDWQDEEDCYLVLGAVDDYDWTYINGRLAGLTGAETGAANTRIREYRITADKIKAGQSNSLAVRVFDAEGRGGISRAPVILVRGSAYRRGRWWSDKEKPAERSEKDYNVRVKVGFDRRAETIIFDFYHHTGMGERNHGLSLKFKVWDRSERMPLTLYFDTHFDSLSPDVKIYSYGLLAMLGEPVFKIVQPYIGGGFTHTFSGNPRFNRGFYSAIGTEFCEAYFIERQYISNEEGTFIHRMGWRLKF